MRTYLSLGRMPRGVRHAARVATGLATVGTCVLLAATDVSATTAPRTVEPVIREFAAADTLPRRPALSPKERRAAARRQRTALRELRREGRAVRRNAPGRRRRPLVGIGLGMLALGTLMMVSASRAGNGEDDGGEGLFTGIVVGFLLALGGFGLAVYGLVLVVIGLLIRGR